MQDFDFILLLQKRFSGEINPAESAALDSWINQSAENAQLAKQFQRIWEKSAETQRPFTLDLDAEFRQLQARIEKQKPAPVVPIGRWALRAAAAVVLLLVSVWGYQQLVPPASVTLVEHAKNQDKRQLNLPDGTIVWLRKNAQLEYPKEFEKNQRLVKLSGEAYFEVAHQASRPFRIELPENGKVEVLGTRFNVRADQSATSILVRDGKVRYTPDQKTEGVLLTAGDKAVFQPEKAQVRLSKVSTFNELAWQTGGLEFVRTPLEDVIADLEGYYKVRIELRNQSLKQCRHTAPLTNQPIGQVLSSLALTYQFRVGNPAPGHYILSKGVCQ